MKSPRFNSLLASTAVALVLAVSSHAGLAQQAGKPAEASVPMPDTTLPPPLTMKDIEKPAAQAAPAPIAKDEPKQTATTPAAEPAKAAPTATAGGEAGDKLRELITSSSLTGWSPERPIARGSRLFTVAVTMRRCGSPTTRSTTAPSRLRPISRKSTRSVSIRTTIWLRDSSPGPARTRWPRTSSN